MAERVEEELYGKFSIKSALTKQAWQARAFGGKQAITTQAGGSRQEAAERVKRELDRLQQVELSERSHDGSPSPRSYAEALKRLEPLPGTYRAMLQAHLHAEDRFISATRLALAAGYENWSGANLHYGLLGRKVAEELDYDSPKRGDGTSIWTCTLALARDEDKDLDETQIFSLLERHLEAPHFEWLMRAQLAEALLALGY